MALQFQLVTKSGRYLPRQRHWVRVVDDQNPREVLMTSEKYANRQHALDVIAKVKGGRKLEVIEVNG